MNKTKKRMDQTKDPAAMAKNKQECGGEALVSPDRLKEMIRSLPDGVMLEVALGGDSPE